jgi:hypothetical protein
MDLNYQILLVTELYERQIRQDEDDSNEDANQDPQKIVDLPKAESDVQAEAPKS